MSSLTSSQIWLSPLVRQLTHLPQKIEKKHLGANQMKDVLENVAQSCRFSRKK
jgi:hypothetical protein